MSRLKGFAATDSIKPNTGMAPALQLLSREHTQLRRGMEQVWEFAAKSTVRREDFVREWIRREQKLRSAWNLHTEKEEQILLGVLSKYLDTDKGPAAVMKYEHELLEETFDELEATMGHLAEHPGDEAVFQKVAAQFRRACQVVGDHCYKEENAAFKLAQNLLTDSEKVLVLQMIRKKKQ
jgi:hemerythrin-like domain-containing protein